MKIFKVIYKYINKNNFYSYYHLIFLSKIDNKDIYKILDQIKDKSLIDTLNLLNMKDIKLLNEYFGNNWISYFFNLQHILNQSNKMKNNTKFKKKIKMIGGNINNQENDEDDNFINLNDDNDNNNVNENDYNSINNITSEDFIEKKKHIKTNDLINKNIIYFEKNDNLDSILLKDSFNKIYIFDTEILSNDTIDILYKKICDNISIEINNQQTIFIPSRLYLWADNIKDKFSISIQNINVNPQPTVLLKKELSKNIIIKNNDNIILNDIKNINNYDIFLIDIYSTLLYHINNNNNTNIKTIQENFVKKYFPKALKNFNEIIAYLQNNNKNYDSIINNIFLSNKKELQYNKYIFNLLDNLKNNNTNNIFITHVIFISSINNNLNLKNIFNFLKLDKNIIYSKLLDVDNKLYYKIFKSIQDNPKINTWNELMQYGITLKYFFKNKFITINILRTGLLEMKLQWKESDSIQITEINDYKSILYNVLNKIKKECDVDFKNISDIQIKFINTIQKFKLPEKINHNKFSNLTRLFHPIFSLVINPEKRRTLLFTNNNSKWGTYLRYKKISNYENEVIILRKILYYIKNFNIQNNDLIEIISKEFNMSDKNSIEFIEKTNKIYSNYIQKFINVKKKNFNKSDISIDKKGIEVAIQGKQIDKYKIRIEGTKSFYEIFMITEYINKILYLYNSLYIQKSNKFKFIEEQFKNISHIPKRKGEVIDVEDKQISKNYKILNEMKTKDTRINTKNSETRYSRECQNSGDKIRRPIQITNENELINKYNYKYNKKINLFEKKINSNETIYALKQVINDNVLYYICDPSLHKERKYIGILSKRKNDLPCCFIKNQLTSRNKIINQNLTSILFPDKVNNNNNIDDDDLSIQSNNKKFNLNNTKYIRKLKNIIQNQRFFELPKLLYIFFNKILSDKYTFYLYGIDDNMHILDVLNLFIQKDNIYTDIIKKIKNIPNQIFFSLNNGLVFSKYKNINNFIQNFNDNLDFKDVIDLFSILYQYNVLILNKIQNKDDYYINHNNIFNEEYNTIFLYNDGIKLSKFYPIVILDKNKVIKDFFIINNNFINFYNIINNSNKIDYQFYIKNNINIQSQIINKNKLVEFFIADKFIIPAFDDIPVFDLPIDTKYPTINLIDYLKYLKNFNFFKVKSFIFKDKYIIGIHLNIFNQFYNIYKFVKVRKFKILKYNNFTPLQPYIEIKKKNNIYNMFKFNINKYKIKNEMFYIYKYLFSINSKKYNKILIQIDDEKLLNKYIKKINSTFISSDKLKYNKWAYQNIHKIVNYEFISYIDKINNNDLYLFNNKLIIPSDIYILFVNNIKNILLYDIKTKNEILNIDNMFISKIIDNNKILIQNNELLFFKDFKIIKKSNTFKDEKNISKDFISISKFIIYQPIKNDNYAVIRAFVNSLYFYLYIDKIKNYKVCNIGFYSNFQQNMTLFYIGEIIKFGLDNIDFLKTDENVFYNLYYNNNISRYIFIILQVLSFIINKGIYLEYNNEYFLFFKKIQNINKIKNPNMISIKIETLENSFIIKNVYSILNIKKYI